MRPHAVPMPPMHTHTTTNAPSLNERRTRLRLRELCDEVIASHRAATGYQLLTDNERAEARALLGQMLPVMSQRQA